MYYVNFYEVEWVVSFEFLPAAFAYGKRVLNDPKQGHKFVVMDEDGYFMKDNSVKKEEKWAV
jgi:hypothetical protein|tara:strand:- start:15 stop:200 length:186 start_codon:yes stop_codon:yes gene_type:complete